MMPVTKPAYASSQRYKSVPVRSCGTPKRLSGVWERIFSLRGVREPS